MEKALEEGTLNLLYAKLGDYASVLPAEEDIKLLLPQLGLEDQLQTVWGNPQSGMILIAIFLAVRLEQYEREA